MTTREFPMAVVISAYSNRLLCPFDQYRDFLNYMTGTNMYLHDVGRARRAVADELAKQVPELKKTDPPPEKTDSGNANKYVRACSKKAGFEYVELSPMRKGAFKTRTAKEAFA